MLVTYKYWLHLTPVMKLKLNVKGFYLLLYSKPLSHPLAIQVNIIVKSQTGQQAYVIYNTIPMKPIN